MIITSAPTGHPWMEHAKRTIFSEYGVRVSLNARDADLFKFGRNKLVGTSAATLMTLPAGVLNETYVSTNAINTIVSTSTADIAANSSSDVTVEGFTVAAGVFTAVTQAAILNGQTEVTLSTALARVSRVFNNDSADLAGTISVFQGTNGSTSGVPATAAHVHIQIEAGFNQSSKCSTTTADGDYLALHSIQGSMLKKSAGYSEVHLMIRLKGKTFRNRAMISSSSNHEGIHHFVPHFIIPPNSDIRLVAIADASSTDIAGIIHGALLKA